MSDPQRRDVAHTVVCRATPTLDTGAYAAGDLMGGKLTFANAAREGVGTGFVESINIPDLAAQGVDVTLILFDQDPSGTTFTDQAAFDIADADLAKVIGFFTFGSDARFAFADNSLKFVTGLATAFSLTDANGEVSTSMYGALVAGGAYDGVTAADITIKLGISQD